MSKGVTMADINNDSAAPNTTNVPVAPTKEEAPSQPDGRALLKDFLDKHEGYTPKAYVDNNGYSTIGHGFNLNEPSIREQLRLIGKDPDKLEMGLDELDKSDADKIRDKVLDNNEKIMTHIMPSYPVLDPKMQAMLGSKFYQLPANFNKLVPFVNDPDKKLDLYMEVMNQNIKNPGVVRRNLEHVELVGGQQGLNDMFQVMPIDMKQKILDAINRIKNQPTKEEALKKYGPYLDANLKPVQFNKLNKMLKAE
jgi:hypothetical protein